jgi:hypothetical protein
MADTQPVAPVKLIVAMLWSRPDVVPAAIAEVMANWGPIDFEGPDRPFDVTDYYHAEMGTTLHRRLISLRDLVPPEHLRQAKLICNRIEHQLADAAGRRVNLDIGYLDRSKVVLASVKYAGQKIHLGDGVYADLIARYRAGRYEPFEWTFPDFRDGRYDQDLATVRRIYLEQLREKETWR